MVKGEYRKKLWFTVIESFKNVSKLQARAIFLKKCQNLEITPTTITIKPLTNSNSKLSAKYSKTPQSADLGTKQNTADCEIHRLQVLLYVVNGTEQNSNVPFF